MRQKSILENRVRKVVAARLQRGERAACAAAADHQAPWITKWLKGDLSATLDELAAMAAYCKVSLSNVIAARDAADVDWEVFGMLGAMTPDQKALARDLTAGLLDESVTIVAQRPNAPSAPRPLRTSRKARRTA